jgi:hypothetical protein
VRPALEDQIEDPKDDEQADQENDADDPTDDFDHKSLRHVATLKDVGASPAVPPVPN